MVKILRGKNTDLCGLRDFVFWLTVVRGAGPVATGSRERGGQLLDISGGCSTRTNKSVSLGKIFVPSVDQRRPERGTRCCKRGTTLKKRGRGNNYGDTK